MMRITKRWTAGLLSLASALCSGLVAKAQITGNFSLEKETFAPGEPVFLSLTIRNDGNQPANISWSNSYSTCSNVHFTVFRDGQRSKACFPPSTRRAQYQTCIIGGMHLDPHSSNSLRILLNYPNEALGYTEAPVSKAGDYTVETSASFLNDPLMRSNQGSDRAQSLGESHQTLGFRVSKEEPLSSDAYLPFVKDLESKDIAIREEAARTLASIAPHSLEALLLTFSNSKDTYISQFGPLALYNLSTPASLAALAQILIDRKPGTYEYSSAAQYLARTHDKKWFPVLLSIVSKDHPTYIFYAAEAGGEAALPTLIGHLQQHGARADAIEAFGYTGSRAAVPILIDILQQKPGDIDTDFKNRTDAANYALELLTHKKTWVNHKSTDYSELYNRWHNWWNSEGASAPIYLPETCINYSELP